MHILHQAQANSARPTNAPNTAPRAHSTAKPPTAANDLCAAFG